MKIRHLDKAPSVHPQAYVAPTAVLSPIEMFSNAADTSSPALFACRRDGQILSEIVAVTG